MSGALDAAMLDADWTRWLGHARTRRTWRWTTCAHDRLHVTPHLQYTTRTLEFATTADVGLQTRASDSRLGEQVPQQVAAREWDVQHLARPVWTARAASHVGFRPAPALTKRTIPRTDVRTCGATREALQTTAAQVPNRAAANVCHAGGRPPKRCGRHARPEPDTGTALCVCHFVRGG